VRFVLRVRNHVDHDLRAQALEFAAEGGEVCTIAADAFHRSRQIEFRFTAVEDDRIVTGVEETFCDQCADEARAADNYDSHSSWRRRCILGVNLQVLR